MAKHLNLVIDEYGYGSWRVRMNPEMGYHIATHSGGEQERRVIIHDINLVKALVVDFLDQQEEQNGA